MLEEQAMERKNFRAGSFCKANGPDSKTKQDGTSKFPRSNRRRESPCPRPESVQTKKPAPQRDRTANDKRPRARGGCYFDRNRNKVEEDYDANVTDTSSHGSKKQNLNHLLNFTFAPHERMPFGASNWHGSNNRGRAKFIKFNKEQFLQSNCQFVVRKGANYRIHSFDPDVLVEWTLVEEVHLPVQERPLCPICLYEPVASKITRCGHIYCWSCILHYLALTDKSWRKCPICYEAIHKNDLKSVTTILRPPAVVSSEITMQLMCRKNGSVCALPIRYQNSNVDSPLQLEEDTAKTCFQKLLIATVEQVQKILDREKSQLLESLAIEHGSPESCFIELALQLLEERGQNLNEPSNLAMSPGEIPQEAVLSTSLSAPNLQENFYGEQENQTRRKYCTSSGSDTSLECEPTLASPSENLRKSNDPKNMYYFYQAVDGRHVYMHSLNARMLVKEYGSLDNCPEVITARVVALEEESMTESMRQKIRYLRHLPLCCEFQVAELELVPPLVSEITLNMFNGDVEKRQKTRNKKALEERIRERRIEEEENRKIGKFPSAEYSLESRRQFPSCCDKSEENFPLPISQSVHGSSDTEEIVDEDYVPSTTFAQMLREGKATLPSAHKSRSEAEFEDMVGSPPESGMDFSDAIKAALDKVTLTNANSSITSGKKKKAKKTLLFTTSLSNRC